MSPVSLLVEANVRAFGDRESVVLRPWAGSVALALLGRVVPLSFLQTQH